MRPAFDRIFAEFFHCDRTQGSVPIGFPRSFCTRIVLANSYLPRWRFFADNPSCPFGVPSHQNRLGVPHPTGRIIFRKVGARVQGRSFYDVFRLSAGAIALSALLLASSRGSASKGFKRTPKIQQDTVPARQSAPDQKTRKPCGSREPVEAQFFDPGTRLLQTPQPKTPSDPTCQARSRWR